ncbi:hypothetical protein TVAG_110350 [Trichomonas vaginalis G3]|uniref:Uncharacterized protein n=1 Tax=Trichomonas vaginalis (strain ATCC PRA-98 / G3) TaxID=412133 RepID=A2DGN6_TRIV3|nr:hypothetical protein TVAGG3_0997710 [Trichomonas vaginalis G3]EAY20423.1 hypothetical protein TVAG_110350 [Trichomonas vaginalis G3]KAI5490527.1 hypothetical protein TVAGG3_0997710 [Trichomonas vaginalis G3]|eukprot:XP_001581409.1 hypothetical protein [Trichomonas vaginalis G3]
MDDIFFDRERFNEISRETVAHFDAAPELSPRTKEDLISLYGCPKVSVKNPDDIRPPSPSESITNTQEYLKKLAKEGFVHGGDTDAFDREMMRRKNEGLLKSKRTNQQEEMEKSDISSLVTQEPYLQYWLNTDTVQSIVSEINRLPLRELHTNFILVSRFYNEFTAFVRKAKARQTTKKLSDKLLKKQMYDFVMEARKLRKIIFENAIKMNSIKTEDLSSDLRKEFADAISTVEVKKEEEKPKFFTTFKKVTGENEFIFLSHAHSTMDTFPDSYEMQDNTFYPNELKATEQKLLSSLENFQSVGMEFVKKNPRAASQNSIPVIVKPQTRKINIINNFKPLPKAVTPDLPKKDPLKDIDRVQFYWQHEDPLPSRPLGSSTKFFNAFNDISDIYFERKEVEPEENPFPHLQVKDYVPPTPKSPISETNSSSAVVVGQTLITDSIWNTSQMAEESNQTKSKQNPKKSNKKDAKEEEDMIIDGISVKNLLGAQQAMNLSPTFKYLMTHSIIGSSETKVDGIEDSIPAVKKLDDVLKRLGYTSFQKLDLFKKYSVSAGDMAKIADTISFWENVALMAEKYEYAYKELKNYININLAFDETIGKSAKLEPLKQSYKAAADNLESAGQNLLNLCGDIAYVRKYSYHDLI